MRRLLPSLVLALSFFIIAQHAEAATSVNITFNPTEVQSDFGQPFSTVATVIDLSAPSSAPTGVLWIQKVVKVVGQTTYFGPIDTAPSTAEALVGTSLIASQATLRYAIAEQTGGSYVVTVCYAAAVGGACISPTTFIVVIASRVPTPSPTTPSTPTPTTSTTTTTDSSGSIQIPNPIPCDDVSCVLTQVIRYILGGVALLATLMFVWGGVLLLSSGGNEKRITQGKETLAWAAIGIVVILLSWTIVKFVLASVLTPVK